MRIKWFSLVRITGLLLVLLYHFFKTKFAGGFIGVDVFFTFSGFLITALLVDEYAEKERIDLIGFYKRRFYRIFPPLLLMVLLVMPFTFLVRRDFVADIGQQIAGALGFTTNFYEIFTGSSYESQFIPHLFVHTWSLAIEVQFYLLWAFFLWLMTKRRGTAQQFRGSVFLLSSVFFTISFLSMFIRAFLVDNFSTIYFSSLSHSFAFFLGAMFATLTGVKETTTRFKKNVRLWPKSRTIFYFFGAFALLMLLSVILDFNHLFTYLFGFILASLFSVVMIYAARVLSDQTASSKEPAILTYLADISYGMYLFHWPLYVIFTQLMSNGLAVFLTLVFSMIFSSLSFYVIEPYIAGKTVRLFDYELNLLPYKKWIYGTVGLLGVVTLGIAAFAPKVGNFENELLVNSLTQAQANVNRTHTLIAGDANAMSDVMVIGDSVALRSSSAFTELLPEVQLDAAVSRNFTDAYTIFQNHIKTNTLSKTVVLAVGVNSVDGYAKALQAFIDDLPKGYRLILVTPYNAKDSRIAAMRDYELELAKKYSYVTVADWYQTALDYPTIWRGTDGVHYSDANTEGAKRYVETIQGAIKKAAKSAAK
ncbi:acyltransferase family protein [Streptococcus cuniculipharyngis]|uniref:Acyltransferase n=1 Tax=Streptococcus cuniculipharyngis TaxID=1562651 RepID=A0A5C5SAK6_9STRE|nr:acyltransferase family protein [Streptococcus cuniculipharyngis]TWS97168.1 acyltransferase [Streptococcus cuniculipharyngis]